MGNYQYHKSSAPYPERYLRLIPIAPVLSAANDRPPGIAGTIDMNSTNEALDRFIPGLNAVTLQKNLTIKSQFYTDKQTWLCSKIRGGVKMQFWRDGETARRLNHTFIDLSSSFFQNFDLIRAQIILKFWTPQRGSVDILRTRLA